ncbi:effector-associated constant component EACC1 [Streptomyces albireticuli]|uniref:effector-associated constant component EACC1 n=1 Tax=Streptomyces albireticuli TaxID=1940 RepID=UPI003AF0F680
MGCDSPGPMRPNVWSLGGACGRMGTGFVHDRFPSASGVGGTLRIEVGTGDGDDLRSLHAWLRDEPDLRRTATYDLLEHPPGPGEMGSAAEALQLITENGWSAANFVLALVTWRQTRRREPPVTVRRGEVVVTISSGDEAEIRRVIAMLEGEDDRQGRRL